MPNRKRVVRFTSADLPNGQISIDLTERKDGMWRVDIQDRSGSVEHYGPVRHLSVALEIVRQRVEVLVDVEVVHPDARS